ncbi:hypothetical protein ABIB05_007621 [Bradyrhizobium sp. LB5.2]
MRARHGAAASPGACLRATMDVTTTLTVQKLGRMMPALTRRRPRLSPSQTGWTARPGRQPFRQLPNHILATRTSVGARRAILVGPKAAVLSVEDRFRLWAHEERRTRLPRYQSSHLRPSLISRHSCPRPSSVGRPRENEGLLTESCLGRTVSSRPSIIPGRQGFTSMKVQKVHLRHAKAFAPDHVMRNRISCHRCGRRHQAGVRLL